VHFSFHALSSSAIVQDCEVTMQLLLFTLEITLVLKYRLSEISSYNVPEDWKQANVTPIFKSGSKSKTRDKQL